MRPLEKRWIGRHLTLWTTLGLAIAIAGCAEDAVVETSESDAAALPGTEESAEIRALRESFEAYLQPVLDELRESGCHQRPGLTNIASTTTPGAIGEPNSQHWFKSCEVLDLDQMDIAVDPQTETAELSYVRRTYHGPHRKSPAAAEASEPTWAHQAWSAHFLVKYQRTDGQWSCVGTDYEAVLYMPDGREGHRKYYSREGVDFLRRELEGIRNPVQAN